MSESTDIQTGRITIPSAVYQAMRNVVAAANLACGHYSRTPGPVSPTLELLADRLNQLDVLRDEETRP